MLGKETETGRAFGALLKRYRLAAGLTQEVLAEHAGMSARGVKYLESGARLPYPDTLQRLASALALSPSEQALLVAAARPGSPATPEAATHRHHLPAQATSFVGREQEQRAIHALIEHAPLVTLVGPGGVGKTRLALAVAGELIDAYPDGVWLVELAALSDPALAPAAVLDVLGLREEPGRPLPATLSEYLKDKRLLLVLDNCEHLIGACAALVAALLRGSPHLRILATSREGLEVAGETLYRVPSLSVPDVRHLPSLELAPAYEAVRLFVARAQARGAGFALTAQNAAVVAQICARLDGIPLAIELAAARVGALPVETIAARLDDCFRLLAGGPRTALPRQQTLRAALDWSHDLLSLPEQVLLRRLAVFAGGWTLEAAEQVCAGDPLAEADILDLLSALVNKSLVLLEDMRYRLLETVQHYARERLEAAGETAQVGDRHLAWCLALAEEAEPALVGPEQDAWLGRLEREHDNLRAALRWGRTRGAGALGLRLAGALWRFWSIRGYLSEGRQWLEVALESASEGTSPARAEALNGAGNLASSQGDYARAAALHGEALALRRELGNKQGIARSLNNLGDVAYHQGDYVRAMALFAESLAVWRELGDTWSIAASLNNLGNIASDQGDYARAEALHAESLVLKRELKDKPGTAASLNNLGNVAYLQGDYVRARSLHEESLALKRELGDKQGIAHSLHGLGMVAHLQGDYAQAAPLIGEALALRRKLGDTWGIISSLQSLGAVVYLQGDDARAAVLLHEALLLSQETGARGLMPGGLEILAWIERAQGRPERAARLGGAAETLREILGVPLPPEQRAGHDAVVQSTRVSLGADAFALAWTAGRVMSLDQALSLAFPDTPATS